MPEYIAFTPGATTDDVLAATPRRSTAEQAAQDIRRAWHHPTKDHHAQHLVPYRISEDGSVMQMEAKLHRVLEVR